MLNINLNEKFINALMAEHYEVEFGQKAPKYSRIRCMGQQTINSIGDNGYHYNGESITYIMQVGKELMCFDLYLNKNNGQKGKWEYLPLAWLSEYFPNSNDDQLDRIYNNITVETLNFLCANIEY